jgi:hypothetical protein
MTELLSSYLGFMWGTGIIFWWSFLTRYFIVNVKFVVFYIVLIVLSPILIPVKLFLKLLK